MKILKDLKTFFTINLILVSFLLIGDFLASRIITNNINEKSYVNYSKQISKLADGTFNGLEELVSDFASDEELIKLLNKKGSHEQKEKSIMSNVKYAKALLTTISFAESLYVVDDKEKELYSSNGYHKDYDMVSRPWFEEAFKENMEGKKVIITPMHRDYFNDRYTISIVSFIKDKNHKVLGCVILNTYMDTFTRYMGDLYGDDGNVKMFIKLLDGKYYDYYSGIKTLDEIKSQKGVHIVDNGNMLFAFNSNASTIHRVISNVNTINLVMFVVFILLTLVSFIVVKKKILGSLLLNINKLKNILVYLNKYDEEKFESKKGFEQLDFIVNAFDEAIDEKAREYILYDSLTKVLNRKGLLEEFNREAKKGREFAIIFIDLNKFKNINDVYGHLAGDDYLKGFSKMLSKALKNRGVLARVSGDEFVILYKNYTSKMELKSFFKNNVFKVFKENRLLDKKLLVTFSAGAAIYPADGNTLSDLIKKSDFMMYTNKKKGSSDELAFFDDKGYKESEEGETISIELEEAIKNNELFLKYQPIVNRGLKVVKAEALIRWENKKLGFVPPDKFIKIAEETREIIKIGYFVIDRLCKDIKIIKESGINDVVFNVNVSAIQLLEPSFAFKAKKIVEKNNLKCRDICIEITESVMIEEEEVSLKNLDLLKLYGFKLSLDDFGTGYTSFAYLKKFKGESLKIDKTILDDAVDNEYRIINSIKEIGEELDFNVVIEGVERKEQFEALSKIGCSYFQGFYFSKPIMINELKDFINKS